MRPFRKKSRLSREQVAEIYADAITAGIREVIRFTRDYPVEVQHTVKRNIPRPSAAIVIVENTNGQRWVTGIDMTYKNTVPVEIPVAFMTGRDEDIKLPAIRMMLNLEYDPRDRMG